MKIREARETAGSSVPPGQGCCVPPMLGAQRLQQSLAQTRGWTNSGMKATEGQARGSGVKLRRGPNLGLTGDSRKSQDLEAKP